MRILGIDPGIGRCGWGVVDVLGSKHKALKFGCIETSSENTVPERLEIVYREIVKIIKTYSPDALAIEELFFNTNAKTAFMVGQARGYTSCCIAE